MYSVHLVRKPCSGLLFASGFPHLPLSRIYYRLVAQISRFRQNNLLTFITRGCLCFYFSACGHGGQCTLCSRLRISVWWTNGSVWVDKTLEAMYRGAKTYIHAICLWSRCWQPWWMHNSQPIWARFLFQTFNRELGGLPFVSHEVLDIKILHDRIHRRANIFCSGIISVWYSGCLLAMPQFQIILILYWLSFDDEEELYATGRCCTRIRKNSNRQ